MVSHTQMLHTYILAALRRALSGGPSWRVHPVSLILSRSFTQEAERGPGPEVHILVPEPVHAASPGKKTSQMRAGGGFETEDYPGRPR